MGGDISRAITTASGLLSPAIGFYVYLKGRRQTVNTLFLLMTLFLAMWAVGEVMTSRVSTLEAKIFWTKFQGIGELPLVPTYLVLALFFPRTRKAVKEALPAATTITAIYAPFLVGLVLLYASRLVYSDYMITGGVYGLDVERTPFFWILTALGFCYVILGSLLFAWEGKRSDTVPTRRGLFILALAPFPMLAANLVQNLKWNAKVSTPQASIVFVIMLAYGILRYGLFLDYRLAAKNTMAHAAAMAFNLPVCYLLYAFFTYGIGLQAGWLYFSLFLVCAAPLVMAYPAEVAWAKRFISHHIYGSEARAEGLLQELGLSIRTVWNPGELARDVVRALRESLGLTVSALLEREREGGHYQLLGMSSHEGHSAERCRDEVHKGIVLREWRGSLTIDSLNGNFSSYWRIGKSVDRGHCRISFLDLGIVRVHEGAGVVREFIWRRSRKAETIAVPLEVGGERVGMLVLGSKLDRVPYTVEELDGMAALSAQVAVSLRNAQLVKEVEEKSERLRRLAHAVSTAQEEERIRISRELHDGLAPYFLDIMFQLDDLAKRIQNLPGAGKYLEGIRQEAREGMRDLRRLISDLRPSSLEVLGLESSLSSYLERFGAENGVRTRFHARGELGGLDPLSETTLFRVAQEALSNVARHARAGEVKVFLHGSDGYAELTVEDDGVGFRWEKMLERMRAGECLGIKGMMERAELSQGKFHVETAPGKGTRLVFDLPLRR